MSGSSQRRSRAPVAACRQAVRSLGLELLEPRLLLSGEPLGLGHGLVADYYFDSSLSDLGGTRLDPQIDFNWGTAAPQLSLPTDGFGVRWTGKVRAEFSETYTFYTSSGADDGVRLVLLTPDLSAPGGRAANVLVDTWATHTAAEQGGAIALKAGETYDVVVEYCNSAGAANLLLAWSSPSTAKSSIPTSQLYPTQALATSSISGSWLNVDIGSPVIPGSFGSQAGTYSIFAAGSGFGGMADQGQFAFQILQGDGVAITKVERMQGAAVSPNAQMGLMLRDGTTANGVFAGLFLTPSGVVFSSRSTAGAAATSSVASGLSAPYWLKLVRSGPTINGYISPTGDDASWTFVGRADIAGLADTVAVGIAGASNNPAALAVADFTNVSVSTNVPLGLNLGGLATYVGTLPFIDMVKGGAGAAVQIDANGTLNNGSTPVSVDANGWPTQDFGFKGPYLQKADAFTGKSFVLTFHGSATVKIVSPGSGVVTPASIATGDPSYLSGYDVLTNASKWYLRSDSLSGLTGISATFTNTRRTTVPDSGTNTGVTNIKLLQQGYSSYDEQQVFTSEWLDAARQATVLRFMDWAVVNGNTTTNWSQRMRPTMPNQGSSNGVAWEYMVQLANATHRDMWISIPPHASNDYIAKLANLIGFGSDGTNPYTAPQANPVYPGLDPDLNVYVEYGNENWNFSFEAYSYVSAQAFAAYQAGTTYGPNNVRLNYDGQAFNSGSTALNYRWIAAHLKIDIVDQFAQAFGASAINTRVRPVLAGWAVQPDTTIQEGLRLLTTAGWTPNQSLYSASITGYFGNANLAAANFNAPADTATTEGILQQYANYDDTARRTLPWPVASAIASGYGLKLTAYETGPAFGVTNSQAAAQLDPDFRTIQTMGLNSWFAAGGALQDYFALSFTNAYASPFGDWVFSDNRWDMNQPRAQSFWDVRSATSTPPVIDGFVALPAGELEARHYINNAAPDSVFRLQPGNAPTSTVTYRYMVRSLTDQDVDLRLSVAATAVNQRIVLNVNNVAARSFDLTTAANDPAGNLKYTDTTPTTIHLKAGINLIELLSNNTSVGGGNKALINTLKFSPVGGSLANTLPWAYGLPSTNPQVITENTTAQLTTVDFQDLETPAVANSASPFIVTSSSDNQALVPDANISWTYTPSNTRWRLTIVPTANHSGTANITVNVTDPGGAKRTWVFPVSVVPAAPSNVTAISNANGLVTVAWTNNSQANPTFKIERSFDRTIAASWVEVARTGPMPAGSASWSETPPGGGTFYYRITALDAKNVASTVVTANANAAVTVPASSPGGTGLNITSLLDGKATFVSSTSTSTGGQSIAAAFDGTGQYFSFNATSGNALAIAGLNPATGLDMLRFNYPSGTTSGRVPAVSVYYSSNDNSSQSSAFALNPGNYTRVGTASFPLFSSIATSVPDGLLVSSLYNLGIPVGTQSILLVFDSSVANPYLAELQGFSAAQLGTLAPTGLTYSTSWMQFDPSAFANVVGAAVTLSWTNPNSAAVTSFVVQRDTTSAFSGNSLRTWTTSSNVMSLVNDRDRQDANLNPYAPLFDSTRNTPLPAGVTYFYRVGTRQLDGSLLYSAPITVTTAAATYVVAKPTSLTATAVSSYQIDLAWNAVSGATGYKIEKSTDSTFATANYAVGIVTTNSYSDQALRANGTWYYRVRAVGVGSDSEWTNMVSATTQSLTAAPTELMADADAGTVQLTWAPPLGKLYAYEIFRGTSPANLQPYQSFVLGQDAIVVPEFLDTDAGQLPRYYAVRGVLWSNNTNPSQLQYTALSNVVQATPTSGLASLRVTSLIPTSTGFTALFDCELDASVLNLYDQGNLLGAADVTLLGANVGTVLGSLVVDSTLRKISFIKSGGPLEPDHYTVSIRSAATAFKDLLGNPLDPDADGTTGDNYSRSFVISAPTANAVTIGISDFTRGHGQVVNLPATTSTGIPITISGASNAGSVSFSLVYDPRLLNLTSASLGPQISGSVTFTVTTPGLAQVTVANVNGLSINAGTQLLLHLNAEVPALATYAAHQLLDITGLRIFDTTGPVPLELPSMDDDGIHLAAFMGDTNGSQTYNAPDATLAQRVIVGTGSGFLAYPLTDPNLVADLSGNGLLQSDDVTLIQRAVVGIPQDQIPPLGTAISPDAISSQPLIVASQKLSGESERAMDAPLRVELTQPSNATISSVAPTVVDESTQVQLPEDGLGRLMFALGLNANRSTPAFFYPSLASQSPPSLAESTVDSTTTAIFDAYGRAFARRSPQIPDGHDSLAEFVEILNVNRQFSWNLCETKFFEEVCNHDDLLVAGLFQLFDLIEL